MKSSAAQEARFEFGKNWSAFLSVVNDGRVQAAESSLRQLLDVDSLIGKSFLDIGSGSGLFSLAARRLGAQVHSFDYDAHSVACTKELRKRYRADDPEWIVEQGSVLDHPYLETLPSFDIVYSWGVLHHTGNLWAAMENATKLVKPGGKLFIAIYNDQGARSKLWWKVKRTYCSGSLGRFLISGAFLPYFFGRMTAASLVRKVNLFRLYKQNRGMSVYHDWLDWLGGFPFEVAKVEEVFQFMKHREFVLEKLVTTNISGNNQFVFCKAWRDQ